MSEASARTDRGLQALRKRAHGLSEGIARANHAAMGNPRLQESIAFHFEAMASIKGERMGLSVKDDGAEAAAVDAREREAQQSPGDALPAPIGAHGQALEFYRAERVEAAPAQSAHDLSIEPREKVLGFCVTAIQLLFVRHALLFDEDGAS